MTFLLDENLPPSFATALRAVGEDVLHIREISELGPGTPDVEWMRYASEHDLFIISRDAKQRRIEVERATIFSHKLGMFYIIGKNMSRCANFQLLVRHWSDIKRVARSKTRPFLMEVRQRGSIKPLRTKKR